MRRAGSLYATAAIIVANVVLLFVALNLLALPFAEPPSPSAVLGEEELGRLQQVYPGLAADEIRRLIDESRGRPYVYEPFTQFRERPFRGRYVNVEEEGFRASGAAAPWPPPAEERSLFVLGGSTAFGYGLPDDATIPSQLARELAAAGCPTVVYNFGRSNYYSTQERILFEQLAQQQAIPDVVVFIDGLNEFLYPVDEPKYTDRLTYLMDETGAQQARRALARLPLVRALSRLKPDRPEPVDTERWSEELAASAISRWQGNRRIIRAVAEELGVAPLFVWQPMPAWGYDLESHPFTAADGSLHPAEGLLRSGYELMAAGRSELDGDDFLWLGDLDPGRDEPLYVDRFHYSESFAGEIAHQVAGPVVELLCPARRAEAAGG